MDSKRLAKFTTAGCNALERVRFSHFCNALACLAMCVVACSATSIEVTYQSIWFPPTEAAVLLGSYLGTRDVILIGLDLHLTA